MGSSKVFIFVIPSGLLLDNMCKVSLNIQIIGRPLLHDLVGLDPSDVGDPQDDVEHDQYGDHQPVSHSEDFFSSATAPINCIQ